jgi:CheY-like chemotaxis protein
MKTVREAVQRGAALTRQILTFADRVEIKPEPVDFTHLIIELGSMIAETFPRTVQVTLDLDPDLPLATADGAQIHQALLNLCVNARDAMPDGGELTIEANLKSAASLKELIPDARANNYIVISVIDTGTGIAEETRRRMFEPFFTTKGKGKGTGLGLALVHGVVKNHGGMIDVQTKVGEGTSFHLYLPLMPYASETEAAPRERAAGGTETLLVVEDEPELRDSVSVQLRARGYDVRTAENGVDAITKCKSADGLPDAVIMDLGMPHMSATDLLAALREIAPDLPIVAMTGYVEPDVHAGVVAAGVRKIVQKPFEMEELLAALRDVL